MLRLILYPLVGYIPFVYTCAFSCITSIMPRCVSRVTYFIFSFLYHLMLLSFTRCMLTHHNSLIYTLHDSPTTLYLGLIIKINLHTSMRHMLVNSGVPHIKMTTHLRAWFPYTFAWCTHSHMSSACILYNEFFENLLWSCWYNFLTVFFLYDFFIHPSSIMIVLAYYLSY